MENNEIKNLINNYFVDDIEQLSYNFDITNNCTIKSIVPLRDYGDDYLVTISNGIQIVFKKRNLSMEVGYMNLAKELSPMMSYPVVLSNSNYGWQEYIKNVDISTLDMSRYYTSCGFLLGVLWKIGSHDLHKDNVRIKNGMPTPIDTEMLIYPRRNNEKPEIYSIFDVGLFPIYHRDEINSFTNYGGIISDIKHNVFFINNYKDAFLSGFKNGISQITSIKNDVIMRCFSQCKVRVVFNTSSFYHRLLEKAIKVPPQQKKRFFELSLKQRDYEDKIKLCEILSLLDNKIPRFYVDALKNNLYYDNEIIYNNYFSISPYVRAITLKNNSSRDAVALENLENALSSSPKTFDNLLL